MSTEAYHAETETLACSQLKVFCKSRTDYREQFITKRMERQQKKCLDRGGICHAVVLERKPFSDVMELYPKSCLKKNGSLNSKPAKKFAESILPRIAVKLDMYEQVQEICDAVVNSTGKNGVPGLGDILKSDAKFEERLDATIDGVRCRCKPDIHADLGDVVVIYDLKFVERVYPEDWWRLARRMGYAIQDAHYSRIAEAVYGKPALFRFWAVSVNYPYRVQPYWYDERSRLEVARNYHSQKLQEFAACQESGDWSDTWDSSGTIGPWDLGANDEAEMTEWEG